MARVITSSFYGVYVFTLGKVVGVTRASESPRRALRAVTADSDVDVFFLFDFRRSCVRAAPVTIVATNNNYCFRKPIFTMTFRGPYRVLTV